MPDIDVKPTVFVSHKHTDSKIAAVLAEFCEKKSGGRVNVFLSSRSDFKGPGIGKNLNHELTKTLQGTDVLLLVYTSSDQNWDYCMWECGVATDSQHPDTNIVVFQCGVESPAPFHESSRVNARDADNIKRFVNAFLRGKDFFPSLKGSPLLADYRDSFIADDAQELHKSFAAVLPQDGGPSQEWPTWPYLRIELPVSEVQRMHEASEGKRPAEIVEEFGVVVDSDARAAQLFGQTTFSPRTKLGALLTGWQDKNPSLEPGWFDSICEQMKIGARRGFPVIGSQPLREAHGDADYTPVVSRIKSRPYSQTVLFDVYFYNLSDPRAIPVSAKMIPVTELFYKQIGKIDPEAVKLMDLLNELEDSGRNRVPILSVEGFLLYMVHRSMIEQFLVKNFRTPEKVNDLTLADLLANADMKAIFENTFVVIKRQATLAEAHNAMKSKKDISDVFVTAGGTLKEPVQGWLSNVDMVRST